MNTTVTTIMNSITDKFKETLQDNLVGIYLHGSAAFGCFNPYLSDIDFITVIKEPPTHNVKKQIISFLLEISKNTVGKGIEMSFVLEKDCMNFVYPVPYQLHFSDYHRQKYTDDIDGHIHRLQGTDKDLAAHFTIINHAGLTWYGKEKEKVFSPIPEEYYLDSIKFDIENAEEDIIDNTMYIVLNLCRVYAFTHEKLILSKADGGIWGIKNIPGFSGIIQKAYNMYVNNEKADYNETELKSFARFMMKKIYD